MDETKLPRPSIEQLRALQQAVDEVRAREEHNGSRFDAPVVKLPDREERVGIRRSFGLPQERFSDYLGVSTLKFGHWENGRKEPLGWDRLAYLKALEVMKDETQKRREGS